MRCFIQFLLVNLICTSALIASAQVTPLSSCLEQGKKEFAAQNYTQAKVTFLRCLQLDSTDEEALLSLGGVCLTQDSLDEAKDYFRLALTQMTNRSPYLSYTYSMLGDIALKQNEPQTALDYYNKSLVFNEAYVNSLVGKGVMTEMLGNKAEAAQIYQTALAVEPLNLIARRRLIALEPVYFTDAEVLDSLKQRYAIAADKTELTAEDRELFEKIHTAEQRGGVAYLKEKFNPLPSNYIVSLFEDTPFAREELTLKGYQVMQKQLGQDAVVVFQRVGVPLQDVFALRNRKGEKIFLPDSTLTDSGLYVYQEALKGHKAYLLPDEDLPLTKQEVRKIKSIIQELYDKGYAEISASELASLKQVTNCSEQTMRSQMGLYVLPISKTDIRYYVVEEQTEDALKGVLWHYVARARSAKNPNIIVPENELVARRERIHFSVCNKHSGTVLETSNHF